MNSLEFIKKSISDWPDAEFSSVTLIGSSGNYWASFSDLSIPPSRTDVKLKEQSSDDLIDDVYWVRSQFEACKAGDSK